MSVSEKCKKKIMRAADPLKELDLCVELLANSLMSNIFKSSIEESVKDWLAEKSYDVVFGSVSSSVHIDDIKNLFFYPSNDSLCLLCLFVYV